jgi:hypothetical protein
MTDPAQCSLSGGLPGSLSASLSGSLSGSLLGGLSERIRLTPPNR